MIETPTKPQFQPSSMPWKNVRVNILSGAAVIERPDLDQWKKKLVIIYHEKKWLLGLNLKRTKTRSLTDFLSHVHYNASIPQREQNLNS